MSTAAQCSPKRRIDLLGLAQREKLFLGVGRASTADPTGIPVVVRIDLKTAGITEGSTRPTAPEVHSGLDPPIPPLDSVAFVDETTVWGGRRVRDIPLEGRRRDLDRGSSL